MRSLFQVVDHLDESPHILQVGYSLGEFHPTMTSDLHLPVERVGGSNHAWAAATDAFGRIDNPVIAP